MQEAHKDVGALVQEIARLVWRNADKIRKPHIALGIAESRFMPPEEAFAKGMVTCGSLSNIAALMLRHIGYRVKLVHGECKESKNHAWISVFEPEKNSWVEYDLAFPNAELTPFHKKKAEVDSWEEIRDLIERIDATDQEKEIPMREASEK